MNETRTIELAVWGAPDSGKTTFIAALLHLIKDKLPAEAAARMEAHEVYRTTALRLTDEGQFPANTVMPRVIEWMHTPDLKVRLLDIPGVWCYSTPESLQLMKKRPINAILGSVFAYLQRADGIFLLFETGDYYEVLNRIANLLNAISDDMGDIRPQVAYVMTTFREERPTDLPARPQTLFRRRFGDPTAPASPLYVLPLSHSPEQAVTAYLNAVTVDAKKGALTINTNKSGGALAIYNALMGKIAPEAVSRPSRPKRATVTKENEDAPSLSKASKPSHTRTTKPRRAKADAAPITLPPDLMDIPFDLPPYAEQTIPNPPKKERRTSGKKSDTKKKGAP